jgi:hypothetical protein
VVVEPSPVDRVAQVRGSHAEAGLVVRLAPGASVQDVVSALNEGADACLVGGTVDALAAHVRSLAQRMAWEG